MRTLVSSFLLVSVVMASVMLVRAEAPGSRSVKAVVRSAHELTWINNPTMTGAQQAVLWGDPRKGAYGALKRVAGGTVLPMHWHTHTTRFVVLAGLIEFTVDGSPAKDLPAQSFASIPGGVKHAATCRDGAECVYFETSDAAYDMQTERAAASK